MAIPSAHLAQDFETGSKTRFKDDPETMPLELALQYGSEFSTPEATIGSE